MSEFAAASQLPPGRSNVCLSLDAFDELMDQGIAIEISPSSQPPSSSSTIISINCRVELQVTALLWDGADTSTQILAEGVLKFTVGKGQVARGLDMAMQSGKLYTGCQATVTATPTEAYGYYGRPPLVPPNTHIVYDISVLSVTGAGAGAGDSSATDDADAATTASAGEEAEGPAILLGLGEVPLEQSGVNGSRRQHVTRSVVLDSAPVTDEMLAQAAASMNLEVADHIKPKPAASST